jgi:phage-related protein
MTKWIVETLNENVDAELDAFPLDMKGKFIRSVSLIEDHGLENVGMPHVRPLMEKLWEIRVSGRDGIGRAIYVVAVGKRVVVLHAFIKKTQTTPSSAINTARKRAKEAGLI